MPAKTPAQKRRRDFRRPEQWANWACAVLVGEGGSTFVNGYSWRTGTQDLLNGLDIAVKAGLAVRLRTNKHSQIGYEITALGREAAKQHTKPKAKQKQGGPQ